MVAPVQHLNTPNRKPPTTRTLSIPDFDAGAEVVKEGSAMAVLGVLASKLFADQIPAASYKLYRDQLLADSGYPKDPLEILMLEQQMWAHFRIADLHVQASQASTPETVTVLNSAAAKLMAEFRRGMLALKDYRAPSGPKHVTLVNQQNVAAGDQNVAMIDGGQPESRPGEKTVDSELASKQEFLTHDKSPIFNRTPDCRQTELVEAQRINGRGPPALESGRFA